jgi:hypothetical protein
LAVTFILRTPPDRSRDREQALDLAGSLLAVVTLGLACYGLIALGTGQQLFGWSGIAAATIAAACFCVVERRAQAPMMPLSLFANRGFAGVNCLTVLL